MELVQRLMTLFTILKNQEENKLVEVNENIVKIDN